MRLDTRSSCGAVAHPQNSKPDSTSAWRTDGAAPIHGGCRTKVRRRAYIVGFSNGQAGTAQGAFGFLNLWAATALADEGASTASVTRALLAEDLETLRLNGLDMEGARELFEAFGTCSISEPIAALIDFGLLGA